MKKSEGQLSEERKKERILISMMHWAGRREHCVKEAREKLHEEDCTDQCAEEILEQLVNEGFVDDQRFAIAFAKDKFRFNHWGKYRLRQELKSRNIDDSYITESLASIPEQEYLDTLDSLLKKKLGGFGGVDKRTTEYKITTFAIRKGFEPALIRERVKLLIDNL